MVAAGRLPSKKIKMMTDCESRPGFIKARKSKIVEGKPLLLEKQRCHSPVYYDLTPGNEPGLFGSEEANYFANVSRRSKSSDGMKFEEFRSSLFWIRAGVKVRL